MIKKHICLDRVICYKFEKLGGIQLFNNFLWSADVIELEQIIFIVNLATADELRTELEIIGLKGSFSP